MGCQAAKVEFSVTMSTGSLLDCRLFSLLALVQSHSLRDEEVQPRLQRVIDK